MEVMGAIEMTLMVELVSREVLWIPWVVVVPEESAASF